MLDTPYIVLLIVSLIGSAYAQFYQGYDAPAGGLTVLPDATTSSQSATTLAICQTLCSASSSVSKF